MKPEDLLDKVTDKESFLAFVEALAADREQAEKIESEHPTAYLIDGALNWKNAGIASFLQAALVYFDEANEHRAESEPSWKMFAEFLYCGKIIE